ISLSILCRSFCLLLKPLLFGLYGKALLFIASSRGDAACMILGSCVRLADRQARILLARRREFSETIRSLNRPSSKKPGGFPLSCSWPVRLGRGEGRGEEANSIVPKGSWPRDAKAHYPPGLIAPGGR